MAKKKGSSKKKKNRKSAKQKLFFLLFCLAGILLLTVFLVFKVSGPGIDGNRQKAVTGSEPAIPYEANVPHDLAILDSKEKKTGAGQDSGLKVKTRTRELPVVAIVIDDMGYQQQTGELLLALDINLSFAFLPSGAHTPELSEKAHQLGRDILLHFPMEAADRKWDPGPGALFLGMKREEMLRIFKSNLSAVPLAKGINNHMGSRFTQNREAMRFFLGMVRDNDMFFLDSMTSQNSVGRIMAQEMGIRTARRDVFLDNVRDKKKIARQISLLLDVARRKGAAVGIGHPYKETYQAIKSSRRKILKKAVVVGISDIVH